MTVQELKNDHLTAEMEHQANCTLYFKVKVNAEKVKDLKNKASKAINKEVSIPGFRPGKAPQDLIEKKYGKHIEGQFRDLASQEIVSEVIKLSKHAPIQRENSVTLDKFENNDDGLSIEFHFETYPEVPDVKIDEVKFTKHEPKEVKDSEIEKTLKEIQIYHAKWNEVGDRPVQEGDFVVVDIDVIDEPAFPAYQNSRFHVVEKGMPKWARELVLGLKPGESKEGMSEKEEDSEEEFVSRLCRITVNLLQDAELPPIDDELAKKAGVDTVEILKTSIAEQLKKEKENYALQTTRDEVRLFLVENYKFDLPSVDLKNLEADCRSIVERDRAQFKSAEESKAHKEKLFENGKGVIRFAYLIPHLANQLNVPFPTEQETNSRMIEVLTQYYLKTHEKVPEDQFASIFQKIQRDLLAEHTIDELIANNVAKAV